MARMCHVLCFFVITIIYTSANATNYCNLESCTKYRYTHTMCKYPSSKPASACVNLKSRGLSNNEKNIIVKKHNEFRRKVASGNEKRGSNGPQPKAVYMPDLTWDKELEVIAQRWADQCPGLKHDQCRDVQRYAVGQNMIISMSSTENNTPVEDLVQVWYDEVAEFDKNQIPKFTSGKGRKGRVGHYTQLVWAKTTKIGCGRVKYRGNGWNNYLLICNYGPAGNYIGEPIYEIKK